MKIAMVSEHASPLSAVGGVDAGGQNIHVAALSSALAAAGHDVTVYTRRENAHDPDTTEVDGYRVRLVPAGPARQIPKDNLLPYMRDFGCWLADEWKAERPHVIHAHFWMSGVAAHVGAPTKTPVVQTFHALGVVKRRHQREADTSPSSRIRLERSLAVSCAQVVATSTDEVFELLRMGVPRQRTTVVPCGVDLNLFTPTGPVAERSDRFRVLSVGRLVPRKGVDILVHAIAKAPGVELFVAGGPPADQLISDPEAQRLIDLARRLGVADRVVFLGQVPHDELPALIRSADVVACTPWYEPFGIVPLEAMACGRPVLATAVGGLVDTVVDGVTGVLVPPKRPDAVAAALRQLSVEPFVTQAMGYASSDRARMRYSWQRIADETAAVYDKVAAGATTMERAAR
jgi:glycosyltransferase involved in cell wall biosynthesis